MATILKTPLQANQLLAGLQKREPKLHDLIRSIIKDLENTVTVVDGNTTAISNITSGGGDVSEGLTHAQVMKRISARI